MDLPKSYRSISRLQEVTKMYKITDACVSCGTCAEGCPASAIAEGEQHYEINTDVCLECGACEASCPTGAIVQE